MREVLFSTSMVQDVHRQVRFERGSRNVVELHRMLQLALVNSREPSIWPLSVGGVSHGVEESATTYQLLTVRTKGFPYRLFLLLLPGMRVPEVAADLLSTPPCLQDELTRVPGVCHSCTSLQRRVLAVARSIEHEHHGGSSSASAASTLFHISAPSSSGRLTGFKGSYASTSPDVPPFPYSVEDVSMESSADKRSRESQLFLFTLHVLPK